LLWIRNSFAGAEYCTELHFAVLRRERGVASIDCVDQVGYSAYATSTPARVMRHVGDMAVASWDSLTLYLRQTASSPPRRLRSEERMHMNEPHDNRVARALENHIRQKLEGRVEGLLARSAQLSEEQQQVKGEVAALHAFLDSTKFSALVMDAIAMTRPSSDNIGALVAEVLEHRGCAMRVSDLLRDLVRDRYVPVLVDDVERALKADPNRFRQTGNGWWALIQHVRNAQVHAIAQALGPDDAPEVGMA